MKVTNQLCVLFFFACTSCETNQPANQQYSSLYKPIVNKLGIQGDWKSAIEIANLELKNRKLTVDDKLFFLFSLGDNYRYMEEYELAEQYFKQVIEHPNSSDYQEYLGEAYYGLGDLYYIKWGYFGEEQALESAMIFLDSSMYLAKTNNLLALESKNLYRTGTILQIQGDHESSIRNFRRGLEISFNISDTAGMIRNDVHKAAELERMGLLDSSLFHDKRSYLYASHQNRNYSEAHSLCNLGQFYFNQGKLDTAKWYFDRAEFVSEELNQGIVLCRSYYNLARFNLRVGNDEVAREYHQKGLSLARQKGYRNYENVYVSLGERLN